MNVYLCTYPQWGSWVIFAETRGKAKVDFIQMLESTCYDDLDWVDEYYISKKESNVDRSRGPAQVEDEFFSKYLYYSDEDNEYVD